MKTTEQPLTEEQHARLSKLLAGDDFRLLLSVAAARFDLAMLQSVKDVARSDDLTEFAASEVAKARRYTAFIQVASELIHDAGSRGLAIIKLHPTVPEDLNSKP